MNASQNEPLVIVTPIYEDNEASKRLFEQLSSTIPGKFYIVAVDDGSIWQPVEVANIESSGMNGVVIRLKRNVGHQRAIAIGLSYVEEHLGEVHRIIVMDSDGEDTPASVRDLLNAVDAEDVDLAVATRKSRVETVKFRVFYSVYRGLFRLLSGHNIGFGNFMALKPAALKRLVSMQELWVHVAGCVLTSKLRIAFCPLDRGPRYAGQSRMNFVSLTLHGFKALMVFAEDVLVRVGIACTAIAILSVIGGALAVFLKVIGFATPGWFSVALGILLLVFLQTGALTLMTLMLTGIVKGGIAAKVDYKEFISSIQGTNNE